MKKMKVISIIMVVLMSLSCLFLFTGCAEHLDEDAFFQIKMESRVMDYPVALALTADSGILLKKDGTMTVSLMINDFATTLVNGMDLSSLSSVNIEKEAGAYAVPIVPGFTMRDVLGSFELLKNSLGIELVGLDYENEDIKKLVDSLQETGKVNSDLKVPGGLGIRYTGFYELKTLRSEITGEEFTAVYVDKYSENGEPYVIMTMTTDPESGKRVLYLRVEFMNISLYAQEQ